MTNDYDLRTSQYDHPDRPPGQHTNGPASLFIRRADGPWHIVIGARSQHVVRAWINTFGLDAVLAQHCRPVEEPTP